MSEELKPEQAISILRAAIQGMEAIFGKTETGQQALRVTANVASNATPPSPSTALPEHEREKLGNEAYDALCRADLDQLGIVSPSTTSEVGELPPLPEPEYPAIMAGLGTKKQAGYTAEQVREAQRQAYAIGRGSAVRDYVNLNDAALAAKPATPGPVEVKVERGRVWIVKGNQSFMLAYEADTDEERSWYADQLRSALSGITRGVKAGAAKGGNTQPSGAEVDVEAERKLFEAHFTQNLGPSVGARDGASYASREIHNLWSFWLAARRTQEGARETGWLDLNEVMPEPEVFVMTWDGKKVAVDWWGSLRHRGDGVTHWMPFPKPPSAGDMYGMHSIAATQTKENQHEGK